MIIDDKVSDNSKKEPSKEKPMGTFIPMEMKLDGRVEVVIRRKGDSTYDFPGLKEFLTKYK